MEQQANNRLSHWWQSQRAQSRQAEADSLRSQGLEVWARWKEQQAVDAEFEDADRLSR